MPRIQSSQRGRFFGTDGLDETQAGAETLGWAGEGDTGFGEKDGAGVVIAAWNWATVR